MGVAVTPEPQGSHVASLALLSLIVTLCISTTTSPADAQVFGKKKNPYADGEEVVIVGRVTDPGGNPVPGLPVEIRASRESFNLKKMRRVDENPVTLRTRTDAAGDYRIAWSWHHYYNQFLVQALIPVRLTNNRIQDHVVGETDVTGFIGNGSPVRAQITLSDPALVARVRAFESGVETHDEQRIYGERGLPDKVDDYEHASTQEESWWYFSQGTVFRFEQGRLIEIENFDPVAAGPGR
jgi:hypothetical protein